MRKISAIALLFFGIAALGGLGFLVLQVLPGLLAKDQTVFVASAVLILSVAAALFVLGVFLGHLYIRQEPAKRSLRTLSERMRSALDFERRERARLERELFEARHTIVLLKDDLHKATEAAEAGAAPPPPAPDTAVADAVAAELKNEVESLQARQERLMRDLVQRKERIADLLAELSVAQAAAEEARTEAQQLKSSQNTAPRPLELVISGSSLKGVLDGIVALEGVQMAIVADDYGLVVDAAGSGLSSDTLAALSTVMAQVGPRVHDIMPMGEVSMVGVGNDQGLVVETTYFQLFDTRCALTIARDKTHPYPEVAEKAIRAIRERLGG